MELPWAMPVMQAPIGPAGTAELVVAVSKAEALGTLAASWTDAAELRAQIRRIRATTEQPFCVNLILAFTQQERLKLALDEGVRLISFSWGIDRDLIELVHRAGARALVQVGEIGAAVEAVNAGADVLIAQGVEAGGHVEGRLPTVELVRELRELVAIPLVAAGGIADSAAARRALAAGANAIACGTVFLAAEEADVHPTYLELLIRAEAADTSLTTVFDGGWPDARHRVIRNTTLHRWELAGRPPNGARPGESDVVATRDGSPIRRYSEAQPTTQTSGEIEAMAMYAGTSASGVSRKEPASVIAKRLATAFI